MANAIPVHSKPAKNPAPQVAVEPTVDQNGVAIPAPYAATVRDNLGKPEDFRVEAAPGELDADGVPVNAKTKTRLSSGWAYTL
jgi:hypothetical protein